VTDTRDRLVETTATLLQRQGLAGTGIKQILAEAGAPYSSLYHHFPGGKQALAAAAIRVSGAHYQALVEAVWDQAPDLISGVAAVFDGAAQTLESTDFAVACPIATVALEVVGTNDQLRLVTAEVFDGWIAAGAARFESEGITPADAHALVLTLISLLEGAFMLSQSLRNTAPIHAAGATAIAAAQRALGPPGPTARRTVRQRP
jgi:AcrR family transcriptional regulator